MKNLGIHHVSSLVSDIHQSYDFYHNTLGLKLLIKTVNQDEKTMYHLFFSDTTGRGGTEFTLFQINTFKKNTFGTNSIERIIFAVPNVNALTYWENRLNQFNIEHYGIETYGEDLMLRFEDPDDLKIGFAVVANPDETYYPNPDSDVPTDFAILGIHSVHLRIRYKKATEFILTNWFDFHETSQFPEERFPITVLQNTNGVFKHKIYLIEDNLNPLEDQGIGGIHHLALYAEDKERLEEIQALIEERHFTNSGIVPREFIFATYFKEPNGLLFEVASKTVGLTNFPQTDNIDEVPLYLPAFLEDKRALIEAELKQIDGFRK